MTPPFTEAELAETRTPAARGHAAPAARLRRRGGRRLGGRAPVPRRLGVRRPRAAARLARRVRHPPDRRREPALRRRRRGQGARLLQRLPPPRRAPRVRARGHDAPPPVPLPRLVLRLRRQPAERAAHRGDRELRPRDLRPQPPAHGGASTASCSPTSPAPPARSTTTSASCTPHLERYRLGDLQRAAAITYDVEANWKAIVENYSECLHCPGVHPELNRLSHYMSGDEYEGAGAWCGGSMTLNEGAETMAQNGGHGYAPRDRGPDREGAARRPLLRALPQPARLAAPRLRDGPHAVAARRRAHRGRVRVVLRARDDGPAGLRLRPTRSSSGTRSTARTGRSASSSSAASARAATCPGATRRRSRPSTRSTSSSPRRTSTP